MKRSLLGVFLLFCAVQTWSQTPAVVTGTVFDSGGNLATSGYVEFDIQPNASAIQFFVENVGSIAPPSVQCPISGVGTINCNVWGNDVITPANTTYAVTFAPGNNITNVVNGECISGSTYNLNHPVFCPNVQVNPQQAIIRANPFDTNIVATAPDVFNVGSPLVYWAAGYFDNLFAHSIFTTNLTVTLINGHIPGTVTSVGLTVPSWLTVTGSPVTTTGTLAVSPTTGQTSHQVIGTCGVLTTFQPCQLTVADISGGGSGSVTSIATTSPIVGGTITTTGTLSCPTCVVASSPGAGIAHFAGATQTVTSSLVSLTVDVTGLLPNANLAHPSMTVNGVTCTLGGSCTVGFSGVTQILYGNVTSPCTPGSGSSYDACADTITWNGTFSDTSYFPTCIGSQSAVNGGNPSTNQAPTLVTADQSTWTTTTMGVITQQQRTTVSHFTRISCVAVHP